MIRPEDILSMTDFERDTAQHLKPMKKTRRPSVLTVNGKSTAVVMDPAAYSDLMEKIEAAETVAGIERGLKDIAAGRVTPLRESCARIRAVRRSRRSA